MFKPEGYTSVSPYLIVPDAEKSLQFVEAVFGATRLRIHRDADGDGIKHAEARIDDTVVMMGEASGGDDCHVHVYVENAESTFAKAVAAGGSVVQELMRQGDGDLRGGVADGNGAVWWISQQD